MVLRVLILIQFISIISTSFGQNRVKVLHANSLKFDKSTGVKAQRLLGDVKFKHKNTIMECDSAYLFDEKQKLKAFNNVHLYQGDTLHLYGDSLRYNAHKSKAEMWGNIEMKDNDMELYSDELIYDIELQRAYYKKGGRIESKRKDQTLESIRGKYDTKIRRFYFKDSVRLTSDKYIVKCDTMEYDYKVERAVFKGPTNIIQDNDSIYCERGWYDSKTEISSFEKNAYIKSEDRTLNADSIFFNGKSGKGKAFKNVRIVDSTKNNVITGSKGVRSRKKEEMMVTGNALYTRYLKNDTLFLHGDTLRAVKDSSEEMKMYAYPEVAFYSSSFQGKSDSVVYAKADSSFKFYNDPVMWTGNYQVTGEKIFLKAYKGQMDSLNVYDKAFIISISDSGQYNQIKGRNMVGYFQNNQLDKIYIEGNGQAIYYTKNKEKSKNFGMNKAECSNMSINLENKEVVGINMLAQPSATLFPIEKVPEKKRKLKGFKRRFDERPRKKEDIFSKDFF